MELIEIVTILIALFLVFLPMILAIRNKKKGRNLIRPYFLFFFLLLGTFLFDM